MEENTCVQLKIDLVAINDFLVKLNIILTLIHTWLKINLLTEVIENNTVKFSL